MLADTLRQHVNSNWRSELPPATYRVFDLLSPHCAKARSYRDVSGKQRFVCRHDTEE